MAKIGLYPTGGHLVKRVIGIGGDHVVFCDKKGQLSINGHAMDEKAYVNQHGPECEAPLITCNPDVRIPEDYLMVWGGTSGNTQKPTHKRCRTTTPQPNSPPK